MDQLEHLTAAFAQFVWGPPLLVLLLGGGLFFLLYSRGLPYRFLGHGVGILTGRYDSRDDPGDLNHFQALSSALSGTLGLGNIAGVAVAIHVGGPGAVFWMWATAIVGIATKFFTCTLSVMYRGKDSLGRVQGGPMYVIREGLGKRWLPLAFMFSAAGLIGTMPAFQINQLTQIVRDVIAEPQGWVGGNPFWFNLGFGLVTAGFAAIVVLGGIQRIGAATARLVPLMVLIYLASIGYILAQHVAELPGLLLLIVHEAFAPAAVGGGLLGVIATGVRRGAFSNEAGIGTESMAHGAAKTMEPVREGLVAMLGPAIDTLIVCTATALAILATGVWQSGEDNGVTLTADAFSQAMPNAGIWILSLVVFFFAISTIITYSYYGTKCLGFLIGAEYEQHYRWIYLLLIVIGAVVSLEVVINVIDGMYALMAIPTMGSALLLAPRVMAAARAYFGEMKYQANT